MSAPGRHARPGRSWYQLPLPLAVLIAMTMPLAAVQRIRVQQGEIRLLIRTIARVAARDPSQ